MTDVRDGYACITDVRAERNCCFDSVISHKLYTGVYEGMEGALDVGAEGSAEGCVVPAQEATSCTPVSMRVTKVSCVLDVHDDMRA